MLLFCTANQGVLDRIGNVYVDIDWDAFSKRIEKKTVRYFGVTEIQ